VAAVSEHTREIDDLPVFWYSAPASGTPILYLHGVPTSADDWTEFLTRGGGIAVDLPGFGRSGKRGDFDYSIPGYDRFLERFLDVIGEPRVRLVVHDWGAVGLALAQRLPERAPGDRQLGAAATRLPLAPDRAPVAHAGSG
jgi:pimeloyl-ACP methyl ester carboxylesterase